MTNYVPSMPTASRQRRSVRRTGPLVSDMGSKREAGGVRRPVVGPLVLSSFFGFPRRMRNQPPGDRAVVLACSVRSLRRYCLDAQCGCGRSVHIPLRMVVANRQLAGLTIADVLVQLRCRHCGQRPASVALLEHGAARAPGRMGATGWAVMLVGDGGETSQQR